MLERLADSALDDLAREALGPYGCDGAGLVVARGESSWHARERGFIELPLETGVRTLLLSHDGRGAPFAVDSQGVEHRSLLLSLSDEQEMLACAWAETAPGSPLLGLGVDLCATERFEQQPNGRDLVRLLLTERERELAPQLGQSGLPISHALLFAAKEAAFKATSAPLRRWYDTHEEQLRYEVRHFVMEEPWLERGTGRNGAAQRAMDKMGIARIKIHAASVAGMTVVIACALSQ